MARSRYAFFFHVGSRRINTFARRLKTLKGLTPMNRSAKYGQKNRTGLSLIRTTTRGLNT